MRMLEIATPPAFGRMARNDKEGGLLNTLEVKLPHSKLGGYPAEIFMKQIIRSSGSVGANYIEANEALSKKDFAMRAKICRKEVKESRYWLSLIQTAGEDAEKRKQSLISEATEIMKIFGSIVEKTK